MLLRLRPWCLTQKATSNPTVSRILQSHSRFYARGRSVIKQLPKETERDVWVDPFKSPPPPKPNYKVLVRPAIFTLLVLVAGDYVADFFVEQRTSSVLTRAQRNFETAWTIWPMVGINVAVFGLWRVFPSFLYRVGGILVPYAPTPSQLIVNTFSHQEIWHLLLNQVAFVSFGSLVCDTVGREHFISLYISAACVTSLASATATQFLVSRRIYDYSHLTRGTLGASGVIYAMLGISALIYPDMRIGIILLPFSFPVKYAFPALCAVDMAGIIAKWSRFDHVCHVNTLKSLLSNQLAGAAFGAGYAYSKILPQIRSIENRQKPSSK
jgi:membrane associated rhomboid family serine protease